MLRKSVKSLQNMLNEAMTWLEEKPVTASAYSQARSKVKHTAFIELNKEAVVETLYSDDDYQKYWGFRVLAVDGSKIMLPTNKMTIGEFGSIKWTNGNTLEEQGEHAYALASVLYDVLNRVAVDATLAEAKAYEVNLAIGHLLHTRKDDLLIMDRNYPSYRMLAELNDAERDFVIRCSSASFKSARAMLKGEGDDSQIVTLKPCADQIKAIQDNALAVSLTVRFVRVTLSTGEYEVLVTSLLDEQRYPTEGFLELYRLRWGIESFYGLLKTRLNLENFTGTSPESIRQDFHATVYLTGLESVLTDSAQDFLDHKQTCYPQRVNRAVSFNAIKAYALALLFSDMPLDPLFNQLTALFLSNPCSVRLQRNPTRKKSSARTLLNYQKCQKKQCV